MSSLLLLPATNLAGRYRLERALGEGASSVVFAALDQKLERKVAIKVLKPQALLDASQQRARFLNEARTLAKLAHPHIVPIFDLGETPEGAAFFVMPLAGEHTLARELQRRGTMPLEETLLVLLPVMGALAMAHDVGVVHRDLKPANVMLEARPGATARAKLLDFGIAKLTGPGQSTGHALGTPAYMAPEQASAGEISPRTDVWAMGVLLFRCLSGRLPFDAPAATGVLLKVVSERAPRFGMVCPTLPVRVAIALDRALEPKPTDRPANMREFARLLVTACQQDGVSLPAEPDPVGLPMFAEWFHSADVEHTARTAALPRATSPVATRMSQERPPRHFRTWWALAIALAMVAGVLLAGIVASAPSVVAEQPPARAENAPGRVWPPQTRLAAPTPIAPSTPAASPTTSHTISKPPRAADVPPSTRASQATSRQPAPRRAEVKSDASVPPNASQLIKQWDW